MTTINPSGMPDKDPKYTKINKSDTDKPQIKTYSKSMLIRGDQMSIDYTTKLMSTPLGRALATELVNIIDVTTKTVSKTDLETLLASKGLTATITDETLKSNDAVKILCDAITNKELEEQTKKNQEELEAAKQRTGGEKPEPGI